MSKQHKSIQATVDPTRRRVLRTFGAGAGLILSAPYLIVPGRAQGNQKIVFVSWGGSTQEAQEKTIIKAFVEETGIQVITASGPDVAKVKAQVMTGNVEWDVINFTGPQAVGAERENLLEPLDLAIVDNAKDLVFGLRKSTTAWYVYPGGIGYDAKRHPEGKHPRTWTQFWDTKAFPGRRGMRTRPDETLEIALLGDGVDAKKLYPLDVERAFKALDRLKPSVAKWIPETPQTITLLQNNEIDFVYTYSGRIEAAKKQGLPLGFVYDEVLCTPSYMAVPKGTKNRAAAMKLVNYFLRPDLQAAFCNITGYTPVNAKGVPLLSAEAKAQQADLTNPKTAITDVDWWADNFVEMSKRFKEWLIT